MRAMFAASRDGIALAIKIALSRNTALGTGGPAGGAGQKHISHAEAVARLNDSDLEIVDNDDVARTEGRADRIFGGRNAPATVARSLQGSTERSLECGTATAP